MNEMNLAKRSLYATWEENALYRGMGDQLRELDAERTAYRRVLNRPAADHTGRRIVKLKSTIYNLIWN